MFTKQHYEVIADAMAKSRPEYNPFYDTPQDRDVQWNDDLQALVELFEKDNPNFKPDKFVQRAET